MKEIVLGFDSSSSTIGYCILEIENDQIKFIDANYIKPIKTGDIVFRIADTRNKIKDIIEKYKPTQICVEDIVKFMKFSTATTVIMLTTFNRMICLCAYDYLNKSPTLLNVASIRSILKKQSSLNSNPKKEEIPSVLEKLLNFSFPWTFKKVTKKTKVAKPKDENYDISDAIACAYCFTVRDILKVNLKRKKKK